MKQVLQDKKSGAIVVADVPAPERSAGHLLVRVHSSVISAGTEGAMIAATGRSLLKRLADKPDLIHKGLATLKTRGLDGLRHQIEGKYAGYEAMGYSCAGTVMESDPQALGVAKGTRVACGGMGYAHHAEIISVPHRLCAIVPDSVDDETAAYTTLGAIAMQGVRQSSAVLGEHVVVIGLGLVGLLAVQLLRAAGCTVTGVDPSPSARQRGLLCGCQNSVQSIDAPEAVRQITRGIGADAVLICAATSTNDPIVLAGELARSRGRIVMVGATGMDIPRELYFRKELSFSLSRSYGPGRYDTTYEEAGIDYPVDFVRFTEQRNMQAFLDLAASGSVTVKHLTTHRFALDEAVNAYNILSDRNAERVGIVLEYPKLHAAKPSAITTLPASFPAGLIGVSLIGAGGYAENVILPILRSIQGISLRGVATRQAAHAASVAKRFGFAYPATSANDIMADKDTHVVFIATRHDSHAEFAALALRAGKHVWVEKPLALTLKDVEQIADLQRASGTTLTVGFNRRFSPLSVALKKALPPGSPVMITVRVNAGHLPQDHWTQQPTTGGGRLLGEGCHFLDYLCYLADSEPATVYTAGLRSERIDLPAASNFSTTVTFKNGSVGHVLYAAEGSTTLPKERIEVFCGGVAAILDDFTSLTLHGNGVARTESLKRQDKGQDGMLRNYIDAIKGSAAAGLTAGEVITSSRLTLAAQCSLETSTVITLSEFS